MTFTPSLFIVVLASAAFATAQDDPAADASQSAATPIVTSTTARILGKIPDGTPPPAPPSRRFVIPDRDVLETKTHRQGGRTVTVRRIKPLPIPPPAIPAFVPDPGKVAEFQRRIAGYRETYRGTELLFLGATVFRSKDAPPRSLVRCWPQNGGGSFTFWSSADFALIAGGINSFFDESGGSHAIFMSWGNADIDRKTGFLIAAPVIPAFPQGAADFRLEGAHPDADDLAAIQCLHNLYNENLPDLKIAYRGREDARIAREAYLKAHPPKPRDITMNYWRTEEPAPKGGGK